MPERIKSEEGQLLSDGVIPVDPTPEKAMVHHALPKQEKKDCQDDDKQAFSHPQPARFLSRTGTACRSRMSSSSSRCGLEGQGSLPARSPQILKAGQKAAARILWHCVLDRLDSYPPAVWIRVQSVLAYRRQGRKRRSGRRGHYHAKSNLRCRTQTSPLKRPVSPSSAGSSGVSAEQEKEQLSRYSGVRTDVSTAAMDPSPLMAAMGSSPISSFQQMVASESYTDAEVIGGVKAADQSAFDYLVQKYRRPLVSLCTAWRATRGGAGSGAGSFFAGVPVAAN